MKLIGYCRVSTDNQKEEGTIGLQHSALRESGFGWNRWSREWLYKHLGLYGDYQIRYLPKALPVR